MRLFCASSVHDLLDGALCEFFLSIFSFFLIFNHAVIILYTLILPISQFQTQQVITSQNRSHMEYLIQTYAAVGEVPCAHFIIKIDEKI